MEKQLSAQKSHLQNALPMYDKPHLIVHTRDQRAMVMFLSSGLVEVLNVGEVV